MKPDYLKYDGRKEEPPYVVGLEKMNRRLSACLKACEGISTEALETYGANDLPDMELSDHCAALKHSLHEILEIATMRNSQGGGLTLNAEGQRRVDAARKLLGIAVP